MIGASSTRKIDDSTMSDRRLATPRKPVKGVSQTATTGVSPTECSWPWIKSVTKMSGTKKIDAVVSLRSSSNCRMRGWLAMGRAR